MKSWLAIRIAAAGLALFAGSAALVACGGDDDDDDDNGGTTATNTTAAGATSSGGGAGEGAEVAVQDNVFNPGTLTVKAGDKVTWTWGGANPHSVVGKFDNADVKSQTQESGKFEFTFANAGTFDYQCGVHGTTMTGKITVE